MQYVYLLLLSPAAVAQLLLSLRLHIFVGVVRYFVDLVVVTVIIAGVDGAMTMMIMMTIMIMITMSTNRWRMLKEEEEQYNK